MQALTLLFLLSISFPSFAEESGVSTAGEAVTYQAVATLILGLLLVVVVILVLAWLLKRVNGLQFKHQKMKVISSVPLGTRERVVLLEVGDKQLLIGVAPGHVSLIESFAEKVIDADKPEETDFIKSLRKEFVKTEKNRGSE